MNYAQARLLRILIPLQIGSNTAESHPVLATRVKRAHKLRGQKLIVSDLRENEMARRADLFLHPVPGTDMIWLSAITRYLLEKGLANTAFLNQWVPSALPKSFSSREPNLNGCNGWRQSLNSPTTQSSLRR